MNEQHFQWLEDYRNGTIDDAAFDALQSELRTNAELRAAFLRYQSIDTGLRQLAEAEADREAFQDWDDTPASLPFIRVERLHTALATAAAIAILILGSRVVFLELQTLTPGARTVASTDPNTVPETEATAQGVAVVTRLVDVTWSDDQGSRHVGQALTPGTLKMEAGLAQIEFFSGATLVVQGPVEIELESAWSARCLSGRLRAQVPPAARGFTVLTDDMKVVDLGTEFGVSVTESGADVQVFDGEVEIHPDNRPTQLIEAG
ncbi:MAG: FecR domain-containing protein, partial [Planctomycetota bacterium]